MPVSSRKVAAASAEPPPMPDATGSFLIRAIETFGSIVAASAKADAALRTKLSSADSPAANGPLISHVHITGTGTRKLQANGKRAIEDLFKRSFGA